jgi:DNA-binding response OmpR family regulator
MGEAVSMTSEPVHHAAYGLPVGALDIVVVEDSKPMQMILRSILMAMKVSRVRIFDSPETAFEAMLGEPPNLILTDWKMEPVSGYQFLRTIRHARMAPLCFVPVMFITAFGTREVVEKVMRAGAHQLLVKPLSPSALHKRLLWLLQDDRQFEREEASGCYVVAGVDKAFETVSDRRKTLAQARKHHDQINTIAEREAFIERQMAIKAAEADAAKSGAEKAVSVGSAVEAGGPVEANDNSGGFANIVKRPALRR